MYGVWQIFNFNVNAVREYGLAVSPYKRVVDEYRCICDLAIALASSQACSMINMPTS
jgi:uncharacterized protein (UPF0262 family)